MPVIELKNKGSLITYEDEGAERCLGFLLNFDGRGIYDASLGRVDVTKEESDTHNALLSQAMIEGLDKNCEVGMCGEFYINTKERKVSTFTGTLVSADVQINGKSVTFKRDGKTYRGRLSKDDLFRFKRVS